MAPGRFFCPDMRMELTDVHKQQLLRLAREGIEASLRGFAAPSLFCPSGSVLASPGGVFVTLHKFGQLRGCIGRVESDQPLWMTVRDMASAAAFEDPRFDPVTSYEIDDLDIEISALTPPTLVRNPDEIVVGRDGLIVKRGIHSGLLLPQVAVQYGWTVEQFLAETCLKARLPAMAWRDQACQIYKFSAIVFGEHDFPSFRHK